MVIVIVCNGLILDVKLRLLVRQVETRPSTGKQAATFVERLTAILGLACSCKTLARHIEGVHLLGKCSAIPLLRIESSLHKLIMCGILI